MTLPPFLRPGSTIAITCPSGFLMRNHAEMARETLSDWQFKVEIGESVGHEWHYFSGDDNFRKDELQTLLDRPDIGAIMAGRGGYGLSRIIDQLDFSTFQKHPKWIIGFSDITVLHTQIHTHCNIASIHGPMCHAFMENDTRLPHLEALKNMLYGAPAHYITKRNASNRAGFATGILTGGNLAILAHLCGSDTQPDTRGKILFIEDIGEYIYALDRMMLGLKRAGMLDNLSGLVCGGFTELKDTERPFGMSVPELIMEKVAEYDYPVCFDFSAGHIRANYPLMLGREHSLTVQDDLVHLRSL